MIDPELSPAGITFAPELSNQSHKNKRARPFCCLVPMRCAVSHDPYPTTDRPYKYRAQRVLYYIPTQRVGTRIVAWERRKFADGERLIPYAAPSTVPELSAGIGVGRNKTIQAHSARWRFRRIGEVFAGNTGFRCRSNRLIPAYEAAIKLRAYH